MTQSVDRSHRRSPRRGAADHMSRTVRAELARERGRDVGACETCGRPVFFEQSSTRSNGRVIHVRCPISHTLSDAALAPS